MTRSRTAVVPTPAPVTALRRLPALPGAPISWPTRPVPPAVQGTLALDTDVLVPPEVRPRLVAVPDAADHPMRDRAARFVVALVEVIGGDRPVTQLQRWTTADVYDGVAALAAAVGLTTDAGARARTERPRLLSLHVSHPVDDVAEVCGHVRHGRRSKALALRLEQRPDRWVCSELQLG